MYLSYRLAVLSTDYQFVVQVCITFQIPEVEF